MHLGSGGLNTLKQQIQQAKLLLSSLGSSEEPIPELINSTNALRQNDHLNKVNDAKSILIEVYELYINVIEQKLNSKQRKTTKRSKKYSKRISKKRKRPKR